MALIMGCEERENMTNNMKKLYLAGPINGCSDFECNNWREAIKNDFGNCFKFLDPMDRDYRGMEGDFYREIVDLDKKDIREADIIVVMYVKPSVGTSMEIFYAWTLGKPIVIWTDQKDISPWLRYHSTCIAKSKEELDEFLDRV